MLNLLNIAAAGMAYLSPVSASEQWWLVAGAEGSRQVWFVDGESIARTGATVRFDLVQANRTGVGAAVATQVTCGTSHGDSDAEAVRRFVCATPEERTALGAMLGSLTPELAANAVLNAGQAPERFAGLPERN